MAETCAGLACLLADPGRFLPVTLAAVLLFSAPWLVTTIGSYLARCVGSFLGSILLRRTRGRRRNISNFMDLEHEDYLKKHRDSNSNSNSNSTGNGKTAETGTPDADWDGIVGFFHPFCNAGGGGERVLWAAIHATQTRWPRAKCVVYTGDRDASKDEILSNVRNRFNIHLHPPTILFLYLSQRHYILPGPYLTLLGQSLGSMVLAWDAFRLLVPDIFIDTMGFAFALGLSKFLFPDIPTAAYVHYPTISTDMLQSLDPHSALGSHGVNAGQGTGLRGLAKRIYWHAFAMLYSWMGSSIDVVMTNSSWTQAHIRSLWGPYRRDRDGLDPLSISVIYPPCAVSQVEHAIELLPQSEANTRQPVLLYIAQFRPEKNHQLILQSFADFVKTGTEAARAARLVLLGSVRDDADRKRVYKLRLMAIELGVKDRVEFYLNAPWLQMLEWLGKASVGVNGMWNEHFGIGVVEYQAAGLISVVHDSGGPKADIVTEIDDEPTGFLATTAKEFAEGYEKALSLKDPLAMRLRARQSAKRFTEEEFEVKWLAQMKRLVALSKEAQ